MCDISVIKDLILSGAAIVGSVVAIKGLSTWKRQLQGSATHKLATDLLTNVIATRNAINDARDQGIYKFEFPNGDASSETETEDREKLRGIYERRWQRVSEASGNVEALIPRVEATLTPEIANTTNQLIRHVETLRFGFHEYLTELANPGHWETLGKKQQEYAFNSFRAGSKETDEYMAKLQEIVTNLKAQTSEVVESGSNE